MKSYYGRIISAPTHLIIFAAACTWQKYLNSAALGGDTSDRGQLVVGDLKGEPAPLLSSSIFCFFSLFSSRSAAALSIGRGAADKGLSLLNVGILPHGLVAEGRHGNTAPPCAVLHLRHGKAGEEISVFRTSEGGVIHLLSGLALGVIVPARDTDHLAADGAGGFAGSPVRCTCNRVCKGADTVAGLFWIGQLRKRNIAAPALDFHRLPRQILRQ